LGYSNREEKMIQKACIVLWPAVVEHAEEIIDMVKERFEFTSYKTHTFPETYSWLQIINIVYVKPIDQKTVKRHKKAESFEEGEYSKIIGIIEFDVASDSERNLKNKQQVLTSVHKLKYYLRDKKYPHIPRWLIAHSTESTEETQEFLNNLDRYKG
jgi:hypothetical protein